MRRSHDEDGTFAIEIQPAGRRAVIPPGKTLLEAARASGAGLISLCGGEGWCYTCRVRILAGEVTQPTENELDTLTDEELASGYRLACQTVPRSDIVIDIPPDSLTAPQRLQVEGLERQVPLNPAVDWIDLEIPPPSRQDLESDASRVLTALYTAGYKNAKIGFPVLEDFSDVLRKNRWRARFVLRQNEVIALLPPNAEVFGLAIDIGTTKVAVYLLSLESGTVVDKTGEMNPQIACGEDVISRINYASQDINGRRFLQKAIVDLLNRKIAGMCAHAGISPEQVADAVVVGNTAMHHIFAGLPVGQLGRAPYVPGVSEALDFRANRIGLVMAPGAYVHMPPIIAGYVGADHSAVLLATELWQAGKTSAVIDIGTNTEITLAVKGRLSSCSCASGPAFEGAHIKDGMRAAPGAIERVQIVDDEEIRIATIGDQAPVGICGSGILDAVAELKGAGVINEKGAFVAGHPRVRISTGKLQEYLLVETAKTGHGKDITVTRQDINEIQLAKAAIRAGLEVLCSQAGIQTEHMDEIIIAGAFGAYIDIGNAVSIGMFPDLPLERFRQVGNAAGMGARLALLSQEQRARIQDVVKDIEYVELTTAPQFQDEFMEAMYLREG